MGSLDLSQTAMSEIVNQTPLSDVKSGDSCDIIRTAMTRPAIAAVYVGFAVADGRPKVIAVETSVAFAFVVVAAAAITGSPWLLVAGLAGHGLAVRSITAPCALDRG
jgi:hypothetical protein